MKLLYTEDELPQRSQEWLDIRQTKIGGSEMPTILGLMEKYEKAHTVWKRKTGRLKQKEMNSAMKRGSELEPEALEEVRRFLLASGATDVNIEQYFAIHPKYNFIAVSFDGVDTKNGYIVELKCPSTSWNFKKVIENGVPEHYYPQVQLQLGVAKELFDITDAWFCSYYPDGVYVVDFIDYKETKEVLSPHLVRFNEEYFDAMIKVATLFKDFVDSDYWDEGLYREELKKFNERISI